ncbi:MAG: Lrp/AsnC family transcriptional regulator [Calothrix sp. SM1_5_4]|nr:Lrp/AsnC family transcriptional regulator [Calothrix sp. SM1_5_4]
MRWTVIDATTGGLPVTARPFHELAHRLGLSEVQVLGVFRDLLATGAVRRIAAVPNHYHMGYVANGMTVWDVDDEVVDALGGEVGRLDFVSHCYRRPRHKGIWTYNLFAMVHGRNREECLEKAGRIRGILGADCRASEILFSKRILKKTGFQKRSSGGD